MFLWTVEEKDAAAAQLEVFPSVRLTDNRQEVKADLLFQPQASVVTCLCVSGASGAEGEVLQRLHPGSRNALFSSHRLH